MIIIRTQAEFEAQVDNPSITEMIRIYPRQGGEPYELDQQWNLPNNVYIQGVAKPVIQATEYFANLTPAQAMLAVSGTASNKRENIKIKGLVLKGVEGTETRLYGIRVNHCGVSQTTGLLEDTPYSRYDADTVGNDKENRIGIVVEECTFEHFGNPSIQLGNTSNSSLVCNKVRDNSFNYGIYINNSRHNTVKDNTISETANAGMYLSNSHNNIIIGNYLDKGNRGIWFTGSNYNIIYGNTARDNETGVFLTNSKFNSILSNVVESNNVYGIDINYSSNNTITGNRVKDTNGEGIILRSSNTSYTCEYNTVIGNMVTGSASIGIYVDSKWGNSYYNTLTGNISINNEGIDVRYEGQTNFYSNIIGSYAGTGSGNISSSNRSYSS